MSELKPCPFCGGEAIMKEFGLGKDPDEFQLWCNGCNYISLRYKYRNRLIKQWNTRDTKHLLDELQERIKAIPYVCCEISIASNDIVALDEEGQVIATSSVGVSELIDKEK